MRSCARLSEPMRVGSQSASSIAIIAVHFGVLPNYFQLWLDSCGHNEKFNWLVFADADLSSYAAPGNVGFRPMTLSGFRERMSDALGFEVGLGSPYKVCDFRPAFSVLLEGEARRYDYWGHCDLDMIFGDLSRFVTADLLARYDKTFSVGHLTLYRNCALANEMFRRPHRAIDWRVVLGDPCHRGFDEHIGVNRIWRESGGRMYEDESHIADIDPGIARFELAASRKNHRRQLFYFDRGHVLRRDPRYTVFPFSPRRKSNDQLGVSQYRDVGVVSREYELPPAFLLAHDGDYAVRDEAVVQVIFGLIHDERGLRLK